MSKVNTRQGDSWEDHFKDIDIGVTVGRNNHDETRTRIFLSEHMCVDDMKAALEALTEYVESASVV